MVKGLVILSALTSAILLSPVPVSKAENPLSIEEIHEIICQPQYHWDCQTMVAVAYRESHYDPSVVNYDCWPNHTNSFGYPYICVGLLQVMGYDTRLLDPYYNVEISYQKWLSSSYTPWGQ